MIERYTLPEMKQIWSEENKFRKWLDVEIYACEALAELGQVPPEALAQIKEKADFDVRRIAEIEAVTNHDMIAFTTNVGEYVGEAARYIHLGLTSSDVLDTALSALMKEAGERLVTRLKQLREVLLEKAEEHRHTVMIGRTHGIHAEPVTFGLKLAQAYAALGALGVTRPVSLLRIDEAVQAVADAVLRARAGIQNRKRPLGAFLFMGPTGVGKTELARTLARELFDSEDHMVRIDMSEYMEKHAVSRLIGAPPGYIGHEEGGQLTEAVRRRPYSVILFDEIEKAHPEVFNVLLQVLDDGRITDSQGRTVDFKNTIVIMTSNLGSEVFHRAGGSQEEKTEEVLRTLRQYFRPEFLNRVDDIVVFHALGRDHIRRIVDVQLKRLSKRLQDMRITLDLSPEARDLLAERGYDPAYGARPLKRIIQRMVLDPLALEILQGRVKEGDHVVAEARNGELTFRNVLAQAV